MFGFGFNSPFTTLDNIQMFAGCRFFTVIDGGTWQRGFCPPEASVPGMGEDSRI